MDEGQPTTRVPVVRLGGTRRLGDDDTQLLPRLTRPSGRRRAVLLLGAVLLAVAFVIAVGLAVVGRGDPRPASGPAGGQAAANGDPTAADPTGTGSGAAASTGPSSASASPSRSATPSPSPSRTRSPQTDPGIPPPATPPPASPSRSASSGPVWTSLTVTATRVLAKGQSVHTNRTTLAMRSDGNLVIVDETGTTRWRSNTTPFGNTAVFQADGNFVVYDAGMRPLWSSRTDRHGGAVLVLQTNGDVCVVYQNAPIWCAGTAH